MPVAAHRGQALAVDPRRDQVGGRDPLAALAQPLHDLLGQRRGRSARSQLPQPLVVPGRRHAGLVAVEGVEALERVRHEVADGGLDRLPARARATITRSLANGTRPRAAAAPAGGTRRTPPAPAGPARAAAPPRSIAPCTASRISSDVGSHPPSRPTLRRSGRRPSRVRTRSKYVFNRSPSSAGERLGGVDLRDVVPQRVDVVHPELPAQLVHSLGEPQLGVGVPVGQRRERRMPGRQVDEPHLGPGARALGQRDPLRRVLAERRPRPARATRRPAPR